MPNFTRDGERMFVWVVTGPSHVLLGLRFADGPVASPVFVRQQRRDGCGGSDLDEAKIAAAVAKGTGPDLYVAEIIYVDDDSPNYGLYARCASLLADRQRHPVPESGG